MALSSKKRILFVVLTALMVWFLMDVVVYLALWYLKETKNVFVRVRPAENDEQIVRWYKDLPFHSRWGWDIPKEEQGQFGNRKGRFYEPKGLYTMKVFGDSFAYGAGMKDSETFEYLIEETTGWECLNYGVVGYGTDQAFLKYSDNSSLAGM